MHTQENCFLPFVLQTNASQFLFYQKHIFDCNKKGLLPESKRGQELLVQCLKVMVLVVQDFLLGFYTPHQIKHVAIQRNRIDFNYRSNP